MKGKLTKVMAGMVAGLIFLGGCDAAAKPTESQGPREVPTTITADFTRAATGSPTVTVRLRSRTEQLS